MCNRWCNWVLTAPKSRNPTIGNDIIINQIQNIQKVVFLCQTFDFQNVHSIPLRTVTIPVGWSIFMPVINWIWALEGNNADISEIKDLAKKKMDEASNLRFSINQTLVPLDLSKFRFQTVLSDLVLPEDNVLNMQPGSAIAVADGFWIYFQPLVKRLTVETFGTCQSGIIQIAAKYKIEETDL